MAANSLSLSMYNITRTEQKLLFFSPKKSNIILQPLIHHATEHYGSPPLWIRCRWNMGGSGARSLLAFTLEPPQLISHDILLHSRGLR